LKKKGSERGSSIQKIKKSDSRKSINRKQIEEEALVLSLDPLAAKKRKKPQKLLPIEPKYAKGTMKITGNFASEVLE
jgi:hypothetical protein